MLTFGPPRYQIYVAWSLLCAAVKELRNEARAIAERNPGAVYAVAVGADILGAIVFSVVLCMAAIGWLR